MGDDQRSMERICQLECCREVTGWEGNERELDRTLPFCIDRSVKVEWHLPRVR